MPLEWKKDDAGNPVINAGKAVLIDSTTQQVYEIDPAESHGKFLFLQKDLPAKNAEITTMKAQLSAYDGLKAEYPDIFSDPSKVVGSLARLTDLEKDGKTVDEQITTLRAEHKQAIIAEREKAATAAAEFETTLAGVKKDAQLKEFVLPWLASDQLKQCLIPRNASSLESILLSDISGKPVVNFDDDGTVRGLDGLPLQSNKPDDVLKYLLDNHPDRDSFIASNMPAGGGMGGGAGNVGGVDAEVHFKPETVNLTEQLKVHAENPALYDSLAAKYNG